MLIYIDDLLVTGLDEILIKQLKDVLHMHFPLNDIGILRYFLVLEVTRNANGIILNQRMYTMDSVADVGLNES